MTTWQLRGINLALFLIAQLFPLTLNSARGERATKHPVLSGSWELVAHDHERQFKSYRQLDSKTSLLAMRLVATITFPIEQVASVWLDNHELKKDWLDLCESFTILADLGNGQSIQQFVGKAVFPTAARTFITKSQLKIDKKNKIIESLAHSIAYPQVKIPDDMVLGTIHYSHALLKEINQQTTYLDLSVLVDPAGSIPTFIVNLVSLGWPERTYEGLLDQLNRGNAKTIDFFH